MINALSSILQTRGLGRTAEHHEEIDSTNARGWQLVDEGSPHGTLVVADHQTAGRGRHGRTWENVPGKDLLFSVILRQSFPADHQGLLTPALANATYNAISTLHPSLAVSLKWPNDILLSRKKTCGILVESRISGSETVFVAGIGVNVNRNGFPDKLANRATSVAQELGSSVDRISLLAEILLHVEQELDTLAAAPERIISSFVDGLDDHFKNGTLKANLYNQSVLEGVFEDVATDGALLLRTSSGIMRLYAADVTFTQPD